jgi:hypothetical protein
VCGVRKGCTHTAKSVCECEDVNVLWYQGVHTGREIMANGSDIFIKNKKEKTCILIDVAIPVGGNVMQMEAENRLKDKSLCIEIQ